MNPIRCLLSVALLVAGGWTVAAPRIIFISDNTPAQQAIQRVVTAQYNAEQREALRVAGDLNAWANYENVDWSGIPRALRNSRYAALKAALGLEDTDPADKGFTDLLTAAGYEVHRSVTIRDEDPTTGAVSLSHQFWGEIGEPYTTVGDYKLSQAQVDFLSQADLIIFSNDIDHKGYSKGGRENGEPSTLLIQQWNSLPVPMIVMQSVLMATNPFGDWGFGWSYGYPYAPNLIGAYDRRAPQDGERFVFPDLRPVVTTHDPALLEGVTLVDGNRLPIYDTDLSKILPQSHRKFSNNPNYLYPSNVSVILEFSYPSFVDPTYGDIPTRDPVLLELQPGIPAFTEQVGGNPPQPPLPTPLRIAVPAAPRMYFAAGIGTTGLYNLSETGARVFLNAVAKYAGSPDGEPPPPVLAPGEWNQTDLGWVFGATVHWGYSPFMGFVHMGSLPWVYQVPWGWLYLAGSAPAVPAGTAYWMYNESLGWIYVWDRGGGQFQYGKTTSLWGWNHFFNPLP